MLLLLLRVGLKWTRIGQQWIVVGAETVSRWIRGDVGTLVVDDGHFIHVIDHCGHVLKKLIKIDVVEIGQARLLSHGGERVGHGRHERWVVEHGRKVGHTLRVLLHEIRRQLVEHALKLNLLLIGGDRWATVTFRYRGG